MTIITIFFSTKEVEALLMRSNRSNPVLEKDDEVSPNNQVTEIIIVLLFPIWKSRNFKTFMKRLISTVEPKDNEVPAIYWTIQTSACMAKVTVQCRSTERHAEPWSGISFSRSHLDSNCTFKPSAGWWNNMHCLISRQDNYKRNPVITKIFVAGKRIT